MRAAETEHGMAVCWAGCWGGESVEMKELDWADRSAAKKGEESVDTWG